MRKCFFVVLTLVLLSLCLATQGCKNSQSEASGSPASPADSLQAGAQSSPQPGDSLSDDDFYVPMPQAADELFDDFLFNFAGNRKLQTERVRFPLPVTRGTLQSHIEKSEWRMEHFFMQQHYYTLIFDNERQMEIVKDTAVSQAVVEKIHLERKQVEQFLFQRIKGAWMLVAINEVPIGDHVNASFLEFYDRFSRDEQFQAASLNEPVETVVPDPDDDFRHLTGVFYPEQWPEFKPPVLPSGMIYNIVYGQKYTEKTQKVLVIRGIANGLEVEMTFKKTKGKWKLTKCIK